MDQRSVAASRFPDFLPAPPKTLAAPFPLHVIDATPLQASAAFAEPVLGLYTSGRHRIRRKLGGRSVEGWTDPGTINITGANAYATWEADGPSHAIVLIVPDVFLSRVIAEHWEADPRRVEIIPQFLVRDPVIEAVVTRLAVEAQEGSPSGTLYAESACEFLAHHMIQMYSSLSRPSPRPFGGLPAHRIKVVVDYIEENLAKPIALHELAALARVSVRHFERAFRQSLGVPPHTYVLEKRLSVARDLLLSQRTLTIQRIAQQVGFSSPSHLAAAFRRQMGYSPAIFRRMHT
ncbi:MAG TPA: helix-turn-helix domain-containing protein [Rudaea sp.]|jgi:AraC family transcriptional regulator